VKSLDESVSGFVMVFYMSVFIFQKTAEIKNKLKELCIFVDKGSFILASDSNLTLDVEADVTSPLFNSKQLS